uniref:RRM domain-containing protein n=1 Tax=Steinernema glaseri TaxID=37863 RepID=A0A1I7Y187_9BILA
EATELVKERDEYRQRCHLLTGAKERDEKTIIWLTEESKRLTSELASKERTIEELQKWSMRAEEAASEEDVALRPNGIPANSWAELFVWDLHPEVTEAQLFEKFSSIGPVLSVEMCRNPVTLRFLGDAFVQFHHSDDGMLVVFAKGFTNVQLNEPSTP